MSEAKGILPMERILPSSRRSVLWSVLALVLFAFALNGAFRALFVLHPELDNPTYTAFVAQWHRLTGLSAPVETLILGDSSGRHGIDPKVIDEVLDTRSVNLCTMGDAAVINAAWQLETYLDRWPAPRRVMLVFVHDVWPRQIALPLVPRVPQPWGYWESMRAHREYDDKIEREIFLERYAPVIRQDQTVSELIQYPWRTRRRRLEFSAAGFSPIWNASPENVAYDRKWQLIGARNSEWTISGESQHALEAMMSLAEERAFDLYLTSAPLNRGMLEDSDFGRYYRSFQAGLEHLAESSARTRVILKDPAEYPDSLMQNTDHIIREATADYSRRVAEAILQAESDATRP